MGPAGDKSSDTAAWDISLTVPAELVPLSIAFVVHISMGVGTRGCYVTPLQGRHFTALTGLLAGSPGPLGASLVPEPAAAGGTRHRRTAAAAAAPTLNFAVRCRGAERLALLLLKPPAGEGGRWGVVEVALDPVLHRTGDVWHAALPGLPAPALGGLCYGWRADGDVSWEGGFRLQPGGKGGIVQQRGPHGCVRFRLACAAEADATGAGPPQPPDSAPPEPDQVLLDPCCPLLAYLPAAVAATSPLPLPSVTLLRGDGSEERVAVLSSLAGLAEQLRRCAAAAAAAASAASGKKEMEGEEGLVPGPNHPLEELRVLEVDVRSFAAGGPSWGAPPPPLLLSARCPGRTPRHLDPRTRGSERHATSALARYCIGLPSHPIRRCHMRLLRPLAAAGPKVQHPGTFLGVLERLDHIKAVGANALLLTPCYATAKGEQGTPRGAPAGALPLPGARQLHGRRLGAAVTAALCTCFRCTLGLLLRVFLITHPPPPKHTHTPLSPPQTPKFRAGIGLLGRAALSYLAPDPTLSTDPSNPLAAPRQLRQMVSGLHAAGVEVILQVSFFSYLVLLCTRRDGLPAYPPPPSTAAAALPTPVRLHIHGRGQRRPPGHALPSRSRPHWLLPPQRGEEGVRRWCSCGHVHRVHPAVAAAASW